MRIEIRRSGGPTCEECGSYELILSPASNEGLVRDLSEVLALEAKRFEHDLVEVFASEYEQAVKARLGRQADLYEERLAEVLSTRSVSVLKALSGRFRQALVNDVEQAFAELRAETVQR